MGSAGLFPCNDNGKHYESLLHNNIIPTLQQRACLDRNIFMQDGTPPYITKPMI